MSTDYVVALDIKLKSSVQLSESEMHQALEEVKLTAVSVLIQIIYKLFCPVLTCCSAFLLFFYLVPQTKWIATAGVVCKGSVCWAVRHENSGGKTKCNGRKWIWNPSLQACFLDLHFELFSLKWKCFIRFQ